MSSPRTSPASVRRAASRAAVAALLLSAGVIGAHAQPQPPAPGAMRAVESGAALGPAILIDENLSARAVRLVSIASGQVTYLDDRNRRRQAPLESVLAVLPQWAEAPGAAPVISEADDEGGPAAAPAPAPAPPDGVLTLTDGQRFPGDLAPSGARPEQIAWTHEVLGLMSVALERIAWLSRPGAARSGWKPSDRAPLKDELFLANGDRLEGFIASMGDPVRIETEGGVIDLPPERVRAASLANPRAPGSGLRVWLSDGTVAQVSRVDLGPDRRFSLQLADTGATGSYEWAMVRAVVTDTGRLRPLSSLDPVSQAPSGDRRYAPPIERLGASEGGASGAGAAALDAQDLLLPGPMTVSWDLPEGARRLAGAAALAPGVAPWGDCEVAVAVDGAEVWRKRLSADQPSAPMSIDLRGERLTITVDAGRLGPVRDRVMLVRPLILVAPSR